MVTKRKGSMTLAEHHARLKAEGKWDAYVARTNARDAAIQRKAEEYARAEAGLVEELRANGLAVGSVWDLVNSTDPYPQALPVLLIHLQRRYPDAVREGIARALAVPDAKFAWPVLVKLYRQEHEKRAKGGLAVAIANVADDDVIDELIDLARNPKHGESRLLLLNALERSHLPQARRALMELGSDSELHKEIQIILRRLKRTKR